MHHFTGREGIVQMIHLHSLICFYAGILRNKSKGYKGTKLCRCQQGSLTLKEEEGCTRYVINPLICVKQILYDGFSVPDVTRGNS